MTGVLSSAVLPAEVARRYPYGYAVVHVETSGLRTASDRVPQVAVTQNGAWLRPTIPTGGDPGRGVPRGRRRRADVVTDRC